MNDELKPCPFCGCKPWFKPREYGVEKQTFVNCLHCGAVGPTKVNDDEAIASWNNRVTETK
jgi:Lar family restriction alleviation protein